MFGSLLVVLLLLAAVKCLQWRWSRRHLEKVAAQFKGPPTWPLIGDLLNVGSTPEDVYRDLHRLCTTYGPRFRFWAGPVLVICLTDPEDLEVVLSSPKFNDKSYLYFLMHPWLGKGLLTSSGSRWHKHRKLITPTFHFKILEHFLVAINKKGDTLIEKIRNEVNGGAFDIYPYISLYALDAITETAMGLDINAQRDKESPYVNAVKEEGIFIMNRITRPWFYPEVIYHLSPEGRRHLKALKVMHDTTRSVIRQRQKELETKVDDTNTNNMEDDIGSKKRMAFLDLLLQENWKNNSLTFQDIEEEVNTFMFEGHDTTSSGLAFTLWLLSRHQDVQEKVYEEVQSLLAQGDVNAPNSQVLNEMKYLECVIKESMRLYPPVPLIGREVQEEVELADGLMLPPKTNIAISMSFTHRHPRLYKDPDAFIPERFSQEKKEQQHPFAYIPFSAGPRNCIGQKFAMLSMKATISKFLYHYELLPDPYSEPILSAELILKSSNGLNVKIIPRNTAS